MAGNDGGATRTRLSRERVLTAAIELADREGIEAMSMRRLAQELGVEAMSIYYHLDGKDEIIDGMVDLVIGEIELPEDEVGDWRAAMRRSAMSAHEVFLRHRWACGLMLGGASPGPARTRQMEWILRTLREAGFSAELTHHAYHALDSHVAGFTLWEVNFPPAADLRDLADDFLATLPDEGYRYLAEHIEQHLRPDEDDVSTFEFGLDLVLDGLERLRTGG